VLVLAGGALLILVIPSLASAYHLEAGGRAVGSSPSLALKHLLKAIEWDPRNAQAYRLLGKTYRDQGDWSAAVEALVRYHELRPGSPLGPIDLAMLYEEIEAEMGALRQMDLLALLPEATVETPEEPVATPHSESGEPAWRGYVGRAMFDPIASMGERPTLFMHPPSTATFALSLPPQPVVLRFGVGLEAPPSTSPTADTLFEVTVNGELVYSEVVPQSTAGQGWHERAVPLAPWSGQDVTLTLGTTPVRPGDSTPGWAGWGTPQVVDAPYLDLEPLDPESGATSAWRRTGLPAKDLIARGEKARVAGFYEEALAWYERAIRVEPQGGDPWYFAGLLRENQELWPQALEAYSQAIASERLDHVGLSTVYHRLGSIYQRRLETSQPELAIAAYRAALDANDFGPAGDAAWTHARLAQLMHLAKKDEGAAEAEISKTLELNPKDPWIYVVLGDIYRSNGRRVEAIEMYEQALVIDPSFQAAQNRLDGIKAEN
jgi:tetratricopeptide (TPR) repeat protein